MDPKQVEKQKMWKVSEVAEILSVDAQTVRRYVSTGRLKAVNINTEMYPVYRISQKDLEDFITQHNI